MTMPVDNKSKMMDQIKKFEYQFEELIRLRLGIVVKNRIKELDQSIFSGCQRFNLDPESYLEKLKTCSEDSPFLESFVSDITIGETYFFRDQNQMKVLQEEILPMLIQKKRTEGNLSLRIWSAGCSTGEEIYTISMMLDELILNQHNWTIRLLATDINTTVLSKAMRGHYGEWSMRSIPEYYKKNYFVKMDKGYQLIDKIKNSVNFAYLNLSDNSYPSIFNGTNSQDLILCRNVLIYFDQEHTIKFMKKISESLTSGGYLMLGASDPIFLENTRLVTYHQNPSLFQLVLNQISEPEKKKINKPIPLPIKLKSMHTQKTIAKSSIDPSEIDTLLNEARWQEALDIINELESSGKITATLLNSKATSLANLGKLEEAIAVCEKSFSLDPTDKYAYFTYALVLNELNRFSESEQALRKILFLDHQFVIAHFQLGLLLLRSNKKEIGVKSLSNALTIAKSKNPDECVIGARGLSYGKLSEILQHEIESHTNIGGSL